MSETTLSIGDMAPEFALPADNGETVRLADFRGKKVILYFYPKDDTPGCTTQACGFRDNYPQITERNAVVIGVSPDDVKSHLKFKTKFDLPFLLVADTEHTLAEAYGVWGEKSMYGKKFQGVTRSHFVIDAEGRLLDVQGKISPADSVAQALKLI